MRRGQVAKGENVEGGWRLDKEAGPDSHLNDREISDAGRHWPASNSRE